MAERSYPLCHLLPSHIAYLPFPNFVQRNPGSLVRSTTRILWCVLWNKVSVTWGLFCWFLIWYHTNKDTQHTWTNRLTQSYKYILTSPVTCSQQLPVLHWMHNLLLSKIFFTEFHNSCFFKITDFEKLHICCLDSVRLGSSHETQSILIGLM